MCEVQSFDINLSLSAYTLNTVKLVMNLLAEITLFRRYLSHLLDELSCYFTCIKRPLVIGNRLTIENTLLPIYCLMNFLHILTCFQKPPVNKDHYNDTMCFIQYEAKEILEQPVLLLYNLLMFSSYIFSNSSTLYHACICIFC